MTSIVKYSSYLKNSRMKTDRLRIGAWTSLKITLNISDNMKKVMFPISSNALFNDEKAIKNALHLLGVRL